MYGSSSTSSKDDTVISIPSTKKRPAAVREEVAQRDPKLAKRIMTNRRSAMRAKERKKMYIQTLECNIQSLQFELAALTAQLEQWQVDTLYITAENSRLKECLHHILEDIELQDALNYHSRNEIERLKRHVFSNNNSKD
ncbi:transcription factor RF2b-like [Pyrus communis]|uniref:transcription factor RF2b-like n=1 Tax=Pyrus communis TaxID=23211 RepID=UPI0035C07E71